jgi:predicted metal-dependent phosphoesterase TrpH
VKGLAIALLSAVERKQTPGDDKEWIKLDLHIHTLDDPKDTIDYSAHQLLERAQQLGFRVLAITLHDCVFDRAEVFADAANMGILLIPAVEVRLCGADVVLLDVTPAEVERLRDFNDLRQLKERRGDSIFILAPHPFYVLGGSIGARLLQEIDSFDGIELCHFYKGLFNPNRRAREVAARFGKALVATSDAHRLRSFGSHYTNIPRPAALTTERIFAALRQGPLRLTSPPCSFGELAAAVYFVFVAHPLRRLNRRRRPPLARRMTAGQS